MKIVVLAAEGCLPSAFVGLVDVLTLAQWATADRSARAFEVLSASIDGAAITDGRGGRIEVDRGLSEIEVCDAVIIPGFLPDSTRRPPSMAGLAPAAAWLRSRHACGTLVCGSCSGVFLLAEAGLLNSRRCTTTWWLHDEFKRRYPRTRSIWASPLIEEDRVVSAGGPLSWIDLALHVVQRLCGSEAARLAADFAVIDTAPSSGAAYMPIGYLTRTGPLLTEAERIVRHAGPEWIGAGELARRLALSERTFHRRLKDATGESPKRFIDRVRMEMARTLLESGSQPIKDISLSVGYEDESSFRRTFKRLVGTTPAAYRDAARRRS
ncbi:GlxA family transcriptional regulator [Methyloligella solikamskensis]|uniref:GlxA family transcriptional regulator n=1 Tax=Methyloligella solikamskensis TaxID=1177756 RepID=A0ABW3J956_9HYPH